MRNFERSPNQENTAFSFRRETAVIESQSEEQLKAKIDLYCLRTELADYVLNHFSGKGLTKADVDQLIKETSCGISDALVLTLVLKGKLTNTNDITNPEEIDEWYRFISRKIDNKNRNKCTALT